MKFIIFCFSLPLLLGGAIGYSDDYHMQKFESGLEDGKSAGINRMLRSNEVKTESSLEKEENFLKEEEALLESILERGSSDSGVQVGCTSASGSNRRTYIDYKFFSRNLRERCFDNCGTNFIGLKKDSNQYSCDCFKNKPRSVDCNSDRARVFKSSIDVGNDDDDIDIEYVGCWKDRVNTRALPNQMWMNKVTVKSCVKKCADDNYEYAGLQSGSQCFCGNGNDFKKYGHVGLFDAQCTDQCEGQCGGCKVNSVYEIGYWT